MINRPPHYNSHPSGQQCVTFSEHLGFNLGNAWKYVWRQGLKNDSVEDLRKSLWYLDRAIDNQTIPLRRQADLPESVYAAYEAFRHEGRGERLHNALKAMWGSQFTSEPAALLRYARKVVQSVINPGEAQ
jgi:hypothetical protein